MTVQFKGVKVQRLRKRSFTSRQSIYSITQVFTNMHSSSLVVCLTCLCIGSVCDMLVRLFLIFRFLHFVNKVLFLHTVSAQHSTIVMREKPCAYGTIITRINIKEGKMKERHNKRGSKRADRINKFRQRETERKR